MTTIISAFDIVDSRWYLRFKLLFMVYFSIWASKTLQKSSAIQKISVTLSSVIIAIIVCKLLIFQHLKVTTIFANHQIFRHLYFVELTLIKYASFFYPITVRIISSKDYSNTQKKSFYLHFQNLQLLQYYSFQGANTMS